MGESAWLKVRSDLYPSPGGERGPRHSPTPALPPQDWDPAAPCFVCLGTGNADTQVSRATTVGRQLPHLLGDPRRYGGVPGSPRPHNTKHAFLMLMAHKLACHFSHGFGVGDNNSITCYSSIGRVISSGHLGK